MKVGLQRGVFINSKYFVFCIAHICDLEEYCSMENLVERFDRRAGAYYVTRSNAVRAGLTYALQQGVGGWNAQVGGYLIGCSHPSANIEHLL